MKFNLPPKNPRADVAPLARIEPFTLTPAAGFYISSDESARRKQALITQIQERRSVAKAALLARRGSPAHRPVLHA